MVLPLVGLFLYYPIMFFIIWSMSIYFEQELQLSLYFAPPWNQFHHWKPVYEYTCMLMDETPVIHSLTGFQGEIGKLKKRAKMPWKCIANMLRTLFGNSRKIHCHWDRVRFVEQNSSEYKSNWYTHPSQNTCICQWALQNSKIADRSTDNRNKIKQLTVQK